ncbi:MAG: hypothetical protein AAGE96_24915 [Cyanobacteria bacterium P01_G01_bin.19]
MVKITLCGAILRTKFNIERKNEGLRLKKTNYRPLKTALTALTALTVLTVGGVNQ